MKSSRLLISIFLFGFVLLCQISPLMAQKTKITPAWDKISRQYDNLPKEKKAEFKQLTQNAATLFQQKRIFEALATLWKADKISPGHPNTLNLMGNCYIDLRNFRKARACYKKLRIILPLSHEPVFNLAELSFVQKNWKSAYEQFTAYIKKYKPKTGNPSLFIQLSELKALLCCLKLGRTDEAEKRATTYTEHDDSPFFYFANAALSYQKGDREIAGGFISRARKAFDKQITDIWEDSLKEIGYIRVYVGNVTEDSSH